MLLQYIQEQILPNQLADCLLLETYPIWLPRCLLYLSNNGAGTRDRTSISGVGDQRNAIIPSQLKSNPVI
jgi:hypothetical protein